MNTNEYCTSYLQSITAGYAKCAAKQIQSGPALKSKQDSECSTLQSNAWSNCHKHPGTIG
eukprot:217363-Amphidinium_carterae.1